MKLFPQKKFPAELVLIIELDLKIFRCIHLQVLKSGNRSVSSQIVIMNVGNIFKDVSNSEFNYK